MSLPTLGDVDAVDQWMGSVLVGFPNGILAYNDHPPQGTVGNYVTYTSIPQSDGMTGQSNRTKAGFQFNVVCYAEDDKAIANQVATFIDSILDPTRGLGQRGGAKAFQNGYQFNSHRLMPISMVQTLNGHQYWRVGGRYLVTVQLENLT